MKESKMITKKEFWIVFISTAIFCLSGWGFCLWGISFMPPNKWLLILGGALIMISFAIIGINFKRMIAFERETVTKKINARAQKGFEVLELQITPEELCSKLLKANYTQINTYVFQKKIVISSDPDYECCYRVLVSENIATVDVAEWLEHFEKQADTYNVVVCFLQDDIAENMQAIKEYLRQTAIDISSHFFYNTKFVFPIVIAQGKVYYMKLRFFGTHLAEIKRVLRARSK